MWQKGRTKQLPRGLEKSKEGCKEGKGIKRVEYIIS